MHLPRQIFQSRKIPHRCAQLLGILLIPDTVTLTAKISPTAAFSLLVPVPSYKGIQMALVQEGDATEVIAWAPLC